MSQFHNPSVNAIRMLSIDAVQKANSGHPGLPMGAAPMAYALWKQHLVINPKDPNWANRDRFVLSAGHGSMLIYSLLHLAGFDLSIDDIQSFRQLNSRTPGHPERFMTKGVEATTGPLGQGAANAVGMAMAERFLANRYNRDGHKVVDHFTYALVSDGDLMEGVAAEAAAIAGHVKLGKLIYLYDANDVTLDGPADLSFSEDIAGRYEAAGWHVQKVADGDNDLDGISSAISAAKHETNKPSLIIVKTTIGFGSPNKAGLSASHGSPLGADEVSLTRKSLGWRHEPFVVPDDVKSDFQTIGQRGTEAQTVWESKLKDYQKAYPELAAEFSDLVAGKLPDGWDKDLPQWEVGDSLATRVASGAVMQVLAKSVPGFFGGDADLGCSTKTLIKDAADFEGQNGSGQNIRFGVREHAMASIANGMAYHGGIHPYAATFFVFSDYMRPAVRLAAMNHLPVTYVWTHDSVALGEDGPTHQPVEHLMSLRAMPGLWVVRPADATEAAASWKLAISRQNGPTALVLSRQNLPVLEGTSQTAVEKGAYVVSDAKKPQVIVIATGSEVSLAVAVAQDLDMAVRVVSMPCWEAFDEQPANYQESVLPPGIPRVSIEAGVTLGWQKWVGDGASIGIDRFGISAPGPRALEALGISAGALKAAIEKAVG